MKKIQKFLKAACAAMMMFGDVFTNLQTVLAAPLHGERVISGSLGVWTSWFTVSGRGCRGCMNVSGRHRGRARVVLMIGQVESEAHANSVTGVTVVTAEARADARSTVGGTVWGSWRIAHATNSSATNRNGVAGSRTRIEVRPRFP